MGAGASAQTIAWEPSCLTPSAAELVRAIKTGEKCCVDVVTAALNSMKRKKVISYDKEMGLLYPVDKDAVVTLLKPDFDCFA